LHWRLNRNLNAAAQTDLDKVGAAALNRAAELWTEASAADEETQDIADLGNSLAAKLAMCAPRERLLDALSALQDSGPCARALWLTVALHCTTEVVHGVNSERTRRRALVACDSLAQAASLLGSPSFVLCQQQQQQQGGGMPSAAPSLALHTWAQLPLQAARRLYEAASTASLPIGQLAALLTVEDAAHLSLNEQAAQALLGVTCDPAGLPSAPDAMQGLMEAWRHACENGEAGDDLAFPAAGALCAWVWMQAPAAEGRGVRGGLNVLQSALPAMGAWILSHPNQHTGAVVQRLVQCVSAALGGLATGADTFGAGSTWPRYTQGPWLQLQSTVDMGADVTLEHSKEPAAAVLRLLLTHMSLGGGDLGRRQAWGGVRELLARHTPVARLWLMRVALQALPQADVAALLWDGVRHFCVGEISKPLPGRQTGFMSSGLKHLVLDMQERRSAAAWPEAGGVVDRAPVHSAFLSTLRLLCLRGGHLVEQGRGWEDADPTGIARYCACSETFDTSYVQFLRGEVAAALADKGIGSAWAGGTAAALDSLQSAQHLPALASGEELPNAAVGSTSVQDVGLLLQLEGGLVELHRELGRVRTLTSDSPAALKKAWSQRSMEVTGSSRPSAASHM